MVLEDLRVLEPRLVRPPRVGPDVDRNLRKVRGRFVRSMHAHDMYMCGPAHARMPPAQSRRTPRGRVQSRRPRREGRSHCRTLPRRGASQVRRLWRPATSGYLGVSRGISVDLESAAFGDPLARLHGDDRSETGCETEFYAHLRPRALELAPRAGAVAMWSECRVLARRGLKPERQGHESPCLGRRTRGLLSA